MPGSEPMGTREVLLRIARRYLADEGISQVPLLGYEVFRRECPPLFECPAAVPAGAEAMGRSFESYYRISPSSEGRRLTDDFATNECYHNRQYMLLSVYRHLVGGDLGGLSFLDVGGSNGYYCFHAARLGFGSATCVDGREEHRAQLDIVRRMTGCENVEFLLMNLEDLSPLSGRRFDVVSAQGILHHLYDHLAFVKRLFELSARLLILDTHINGRVDPTADMFLEAAENPRDSPFSRLSLTPSLSVLVELVKAAGFRTIHWVPYPGQIVRNDDARSDRYGYGALRRIMLAAAP
jgi:SAM-dependent methyltransferase